MGVRAPVRCVLVRGFAQWTNLFYGSVPVYFAVTPGTAYGYAPGVVGEALTDEAARAARAREQPGAGLGPDYAKLVVAAIPAPDLTISRRPVSDSVPVPLRQALIKVPAGSPGIVLTGVASGVRSALVCLGGTWFRLKGCGNHDQGFPIKPVESTPSLDNIRGCSFVHTTAREMLFADRIRNAVASLGIACCNTGVGWFEYDMPSAPYPAVRRACSICVTLGDKRLGSHVLLGLERLLPRLVDASKAAEQIKSSGLFASERLDGDTGLPFSADMAAAMGMAPVDGCAVALFESSPSSDCPAGGAEAAELWALCADELRGVLRPGVPSMLAYVYWRVGFEAGEFLRALHAADLSWGTYPDAMGVHCNAHVNNLVAVARAQHASLRRFFAPLDFDMAFSRAEFETMRRTDSPSAERWTWQNVLDQERVGMRQTLTGDTFTSTGVAGAAELSAEQSAVRTVLRDTALCGFDAGYAGGADAHPYQARLAGSVYNLFALAVMETSSVIA